ncbi:uncharacterized protein LOC120942925 isoform X2 [Rana temporaria]|uniref:uncharacterized protein LOC120942925 isoform X2 n=1 Tax=Rana temporaria TaxID=8407 RepID=UPI001AAC88C4|nr:uncharacterized protein LOC120942925 isoform X2 [Rana temporaria]
MDQFTKAKLGPIPLPFILFIFLLSLWIFFSIGENSLLYSLCMIITILLKGSLLSRWCIWKYTPPPQWLILVSGVIVLQIYIIGEDLRISTFSLIVLVPLSTVSGVGIFLSQPDHQEEGRSNSQVIGIFSRSAAEEYNWLSAALRSSGKAVPFYITNSNFREFRDQVSKCAFAILYHSKTRGRVNVTDVTDSLYDDEVKHMSQALGREKVVVVVDDLDDSSEGAKNRILQSQGTIRDQTRDLYLFTREEKRDEERIKEKLQPFLRTLSRGSSSHLIVDVVGTLILCGPWLHYCVGVYDGAILILSNIGGSLLIYNFLLPFGLSGTVLPLTYPIDRTKRVPRGTKKGSPWAGLPALVVVMALESLAAYWYCSGLKAVLLFAQSVLTLLYAVLLSASSTFSAAP